MRHLPLRVARLLSVSVPCVSLGRFLYTSLHSRRRSASFPAQHAGLEVRAACTLRRRTSCFGPARCLEDALHRVCGGYVRRLPFRQRIAVAAAPRHPSLQALCRPCLPNQPPIGGLHAAHPPLPAPGLVRRPHAPHLAAAMAHAAAARPRGCGAGAGGRAWCGAGSSQRQLRPWRCRGGSRGAARPTARVLGCVFTGSPWLAPACCVLPNAGRACQPPPPPTPCRSWRPA